MENKDNEFKEETVKGEPIAVEATTPKNKVFTSPLLSDYTFKDNVDSNGLYALAPSGDFSIVGETALTVNSWIKTSGENDGKMVFPESVDEDDIIAISNTMSTSDRVYTSDPYATLLNGNVENDISYGDIKLRPRILKGKKNTEGGALNVLARAVSTGNNIQIPLWNSGFWIAMATPGGEELSIIKRKLDAADIDITRAAVGAIPLSSKSSMLYRILVESIEKNLISTTLALPKNENIKAYIVNSDLPIISAYLSWAMYPLGKNTLVPCYYTAKLDKEGKPLCNTIENAVLDLSNLVKVDRVNRMDDWMIEVMSRREPGSVDPKTAKEYTRKVALYNTKSVMTTTLTNTAGEEFELEIKFKNPYIKEYFKQSTSWYDSLVAKAEELIVYDGEDREVAVDNMMTHSVLGIYSSYIEYIKINDEMIKSEKKIDQALKLLSNGTEAYTAYFKGVNEFIGASTIAVPAVASYVCPKCQDKHKELDIVVPEKIAIEPLTHFLELLGLKLESIEKAVN